MTTLAEDLRTMRALKDTAEADGKDKKEADAAFKQHQKRCLDRMEAEEAESFRTTGYLYSVVNKVKGQIEDRAPYVRWALENDEGIQEFLDWLDEQVPAHKYKTTGELERRFYDAI